MVQLLVGRHILLVVEGFSPSLSHHAQRSLSRFSFVSSTTRILSSQWDDDDDDTAKPTSFEDAGVQLREEDDKKAMDAVPDYDTNPAVSGVRWQRCEIFERREVW